MTSAPAAAAQLASGEAGASSAPDEEEAKKVARELEERIAGRYEKLRREEQHLATLHKQIQEMEGPQRHGIEQLRQEIVRVGADLSQWTGELGKAEKRLAAATAELQERQQVKASLSERLFGLLLESEEMRTEKLQSVAQELEHIEGTPAKAGEAAKT